MGLEPLGAVNSLCLHGIRVDTSMLCYFPESSPRSGASLRWNSLPACLVSAVNMRLEVIDIVRESLIVCGLGSSQVLAQWNPR